MILEAFITLITKLLDVLWIVELPGLPDSVMNAIDSFISYIGDAMKLITFFIPIQVVVLMSTLGIVLAGAYAIYESYVLVMWVLRKIPMLGIE